MAGSVSIGIQENGYNLTASSTSYVLKGGDAVFAPDAHAIYEASSLQGNTLHIDGTVKALTSGHYGIYSQGTDTKLAIGQGGIIDGANGVYTNGAGVAVDNQGMISGDSIGILLDSSHGTLTNSGSVIGKDFGIYINGQDAHIINQGIIQASNALLIENTGAAFENDGTILGHIGASGADHLKLKLGSASVLSSAGNALDINSQSGESAHVVNFGRINCVGSAISTDGGDEVVVNRGVISGSVSLGGGSDVFDNRGGTLLSTNSYGYGGHDVSGGDGDDTYFIDTRINTIELAGGGTDTVKATLSISFGAGNFAGQELENLTLLGTKNISGTGNGFDNVLIGNAGNNKLFGMAGADHLSGGGGNDMLTGGADGDTFVFKSHFGKDVITDFENGIDHIDLSHWAGVDSFADLKAHHLTVSGDDIVIHNGTDSLTLHDAAKSDLDASDFVF